MRRTPSAFSLIELLVVIGIIALLLTILMPVLAKVRKAGRSTVCLSHLSQLGQSYQMYLNNNGGRSFMPQQDLTGQTWYELLQPYNSDVPHSILCPDATEPGNLIGSATKAWGPNRTYVKTAPDWIARNVFVGSYGFNGWLYRIPQEQFPKIDPSWQQHTIELPTVHNAEIPVFADCTMDMATPTDADDVPRNLQQPLPFYNGAGPKPWGPKGQMAYYCIDRHNRGVNAVYLDGHASRIPLEELWKQRWNNDFTPKDVVIPR